jgi:Ca2+-binding RTX toxin-like protein
MSMAIITGTTGDDTITPEGNSAGVTVINPPGGPFAGDVDQISSLAGGDFVDGGLGDDTAILGDGDDRFRWDPGEGSDDVRGGRGTDTLEFNGADAAEQFTISDGANLDVDLFRNVGNILMELSSVEVIELNALGGDDNVNATGLTEPTALIVNGGQGNDTAILGPVDDRFIWNPGDGDDTVDGRAGSDTLEFNGSDGDEEFVTFGSAANAELFRDVGDILMDLTNIEEIELNGLGGNDNVDAAGLAEDVDLTADGGAGNDTVIAGAGDDEVRGGAGSDNMRGGAGADRFAFGAETGDGTTDFDTIGDYAQAEGDVIDLSQSGGLVDAESTDGDLLLTLGGGDADQVFLAGVASEDDVDFIFA